MRRLWNNYLNLLFLTDHVDSSVIVSSMMNEKMNSVLIRYPMVIHSLLLCMRDHMV